MRERNENVFFFPLDKKVCLNIIPFKFLWVNSQISDYRIWWLSANKLPYKERDRYVCVFFLPIYINSFPHVLNAHIYVIIYINTSIRILQKATFLTLLIWRWQNYKGNMITIFYNPLSRGQNVSLTERYITSSRRGNDNTEQTKIRKLILIQNLLCGRTALGPL